MPGPDPRTRSTATGTKEVAGTKRMGDPLREGKKGTSTRDPSKEDREKGEKTAIGALGAEKKKPKLKQPGPVGSIDRKQGLGRIIDGKFYPAMAKGGRAMYKSGMRVCKLAKRGKGRAYGKNS